MTLVRRGIALTEKGSGVEVKFTSGERRFVLNARLTGNAADQDKIILEAGRPVPYSPMGGKQ